MNLYSSELELKKSFAKHLADTCDDTMYLNNLNLLNVELIRGGYTPFNMKINYGIIVPSTTKEVAMIDGYGYSISEVMS